MGEIVVLLSLSASIWFSPFLSRLLKIPTAPVEIVIGSLLAFAGLVGQHDYFDLVSSVGFLYLMFLAGLETDLKQITSSTPYILQRALLFVVALWLLGGIAGYIFELNIFIIISLPLVSIGLLAPLTKIYGKDVAWIKLAFIVGVLGEIISIAALTILDAASTVGFGEEFVLEIVYLALFIVGIYILYRLLAILFWWHPEIREILMPRDDASDQAIRLSMALFFIFIALMLMFHLELALGAFIAGVAISAFFHNEKDLEEKLSSLGFGMLVPIFFLHVGASFDIRILVMPGVVSGALKITMIMFAMRMIAAFVLRNIGARRDALLVSLSLSMPLTLLVAVATIGYHSQNIDLYTYYMMLLASLLEVIVAMAAIKIIANIITPPTNIPKH